MFRLKSLIIVAICTLYSPLRSDAYSVLTHEAIIDATWDKTIQPLLLKKYPLSTEDQLKDAHAYAYGGAVAPDMGYYPFGSKLFTNLVHYVRSGDFVNALLDESEDLNEYAFALGFLCHYYADKYGHPIGTNCCVPLVYPKDKEKFGTIVTYQQDPVSHIRMEFGFDILQTARGNYATDKYHSFIGFKLSRPVLERAFLKTYGLSLDDVFKNFPLAVETFRWIIKDLFPVVTRAAWAAKRKDIIKTNPGITRRKFEYKMRKANYYHEYGKKHEKPGFFPGVISKIVTVLPKVGPMKSFKLTVPGPDAERIFIQSFDTVQIHFTNTLTILASKNICFPNIDFDTGNETSPGEYVLADKAYSELLLKLKGDNFKRVNTNLKQNVIAFYSAYNYKNAITAEPDTQQKMAEALYTLNMTTPVN
jgi:hypothetical protein